MDPTQITYSDYYAQFQLDAQADPTIDQNSVTDFINWLDQNVGGGSTQQPTSIPIPADADTSAITSNLPNFTANDLQN